MWLSSRRSKRICTKNKPILKTQQKSKSEWQNVFAKEINKIALTSSYDKRMQLIDLSETYRYGTRKDLICKKEKIQRNNIIKQHKMFDFDITKENTKEQNPEWQEVPDHPHRILMLGGSGCGKTNALLNLINNEPDLKKFIYTLKIHLKRNNNF